MEKIIEKIRHLMFNANTKVINENL